jgi:predicted nucleotide-binding protein
MAINADLIKFFITRVRDSDGQSFGPETTQLFDHLNSEIKENTFFEKYNSEYTKWANWYSQASTEGMWFLPTNHVDTKSLSFNLYKLISNLGEKGYGVPESLFKEISMQKNIDEFNKKFLDYFELALNDILFEDSEKPSEVEKKSLGDTVFIIHGHDDELKIELQLLLTRAKIKSIVLHEQPDKGRTIIEKLIEEGISANYAIAIFSPDDNMEDGAKRPRQNVILELGYFIGRLGKPRVRILKKGTIEIPSDLNGILYEQYDKENNWKIKILKELFAVGMTIDFETVMKNI